MKKDNGITLVALIITIIVMLILAGIAFGMTIGDEGIISRTQGAKQEQEEATEIEYIKTEMASYYVKGNGKLNISLFGEDKKIIANGKEYKVIEDENIENDYEIIKNENGEFLVKIKAGNKTPELPGDEDENKFYGYAYTTIEDGANVYTYYLENGVCFFYIEDSLIIIDGYTKEENFIHAFGADRMLSEDGSILQDIEYGSTVLNRVDDKKYTFNGIKDETYNIYKNAAYFSATTKSFLAVIQYEGDDACIVNGRKIGTEEYVDDMELSEFIGNGAIVSTDGEEVIYNGVTYKLVKK